MAIPPIPAVKGKLSARNYNAEEILSTKPFTLKKRYSITKNFKKYF